MRASRFSVEERDRQDLREVIHAICDGVDRRRWAQVQAAFAERVVLDYGTPELLAPEEIVGRWRPLLSAFDRTEHRLGEADLRLLERDRARVEVPFEAEHELRGAAGGDAWTLAGRYELEALRGPAGWRVSRMRMVPTGSAGNARLIAAAQARAGLPAAAPPPLRVERIAFEVEGEPVLGNLYLPADAGEGLRLPAVGLFATWTATKEMIVPHHAAHLARAGFAVLTIDFRGFGESGGAERRTESPARKVRDIRGAVDVLARHPSVAPERLGLVGICAGAQYVAAEAADDPRVRALAFVAPWFHDAGILEEVYGGAAGVAERRRIGLEARRRFEETGVIDYVPVASNADPRAAMYWPGDALAYYLDVRRGGIPQWGNQFALMAWPEWLGFDGIAPAARLRQPALLVHAETAAIPRGAHRFAAAMAARPKELWLEGPSQFDFYDRPDVVARAAAEVIAHLQATLG